MKIDLILKFLSVAQRMNNNYKQPRKLNFKSPKKKSPPKEARSCKSKIPAGHYKESRIRKSSPKGKQKKHFQEVVPVYLEGQHSADNSIINDSEQVLGIRKAVSENDLSSNSIEYQSSSNIERHQTITDPENPEVQPTSSTEIHKSAAVSNLFATEFFEEININEFDLSSDWILQVSEIFSDQSDSSDDFSTDDFSTDNFVLPSPIPRAQSVPNIYLSSVFDLSTNFVPESSDDLNMSAQEALKKLEAENKKKDAELAQLRAQLSAQQTASQVNLNETSQFGTGNVTGAQMLIMMQHLSREIQLTNPNRSRNETSVSIESCFEYKIRNFNIDGATEALALSPQGTRHLLTIKEVEFKAEDVNYDNTMKLLSQFSIENTKLKKWIGPKDIRPPEQFLIDFETNVRPYAKSNKSYNNIFLQMLSGLSVHNFKQSVKPDTPWHLNAIRFMQEFANDSYWVADQTSFTQDVKKPQQSVTDFVTFWLTRMRWNPSVSSVWVSEMLCSKIPEKYTKVFEKITENDDVPAIIELVRRLENRGQRQVESSMISSNEYYLQHTKPELDKERGKNSSSNSSSSSFKTNYSSNDFKKNTNQNSSLPSSSSSSSSSSHPPKPDLSKKPFAKFEKGQLMKKVPSADSKKAKFKAINNVECIDWTEPNLEIFCIDDNYDLKKFEKPESDIEVEIEEDDSISVDMDSLNL